MKLSAVFPLILVAGITSACTDDPIQPEAERAPAQASLVADAAPGHVVEFRKGAPPEFAAEVAALGGTVAFVSEALGIARVEGLSGQAVAKLGRQRGVAMIYDDVRVHLAVAPSYGAVEALAAEPASVLNPASGIGFSYQWNMRRIGAHTAWAAGHLGSPDVSIAILDTGIDYDGYDANGLVDLARSKSFIPGDDAIVAAAFPGRHPIDDLNGHGSNVASQASSRATIFAGVNSRTTLIGVKVLGYNGSGTLASILAGLVHAAEQGADVANMSLGFRFGVSKIGNGPFVALTNRAFNYAHRQGMIVVVSAGNDATNMDGAGVIFQAYCEAPHVICVSATGPTASANPFSGPWTNEDAGASYSNIGKQAVTVAAPGGTTSGYVASVCARHGIVEVEGKLYLTICNQPPGFFVVTGYAGTSQAAPHVAGLVAKLVEIHGRNNPAQVKHALLKSVDDLGPRGRDPVYGAGRINVARALGL